MNWMKLMLLTLPMCTAGCAFKQSDSPTATNPEVAPSSVRAPKEYVSFKFASNKTLIELHRTFHKRNDYAGVHIDAPLTLPEDVPETIHLWIPRLQLNERDASLRLRAVARDRNSSRVDVVLALRETFGEQGMGFEISGLAKALKELDATGQTITVEMTSRRIARAQPLIQFHVRTAPKEYEAKFVSVTEYQKSGDLRDMNLFINRWISLKQERVYLIGLLQFSNTSDIPESVSIEQLRKTNLTTRLKRFSPVSVGCGYLNEPQIEEQLLSDRLLFLPLNTQTENYLASLQNSTSVPRRVSEVIDSGNTSTWAIFAAGERASFRQKSQLQNVKMVSRCDWQCSVGGGQPGTMTPPYACGMAPSFCEPQIACWECHQGNSAKCGRCKQEDDRRYSQRMTTFCHNYSNWRQIQVFNQTPVGVDAQTFLDLSNAPDLVRLRHGDLDESLDPESRIVEIVPTEIPMID